MAWWAVLLMAAMPVSLTMVAALRVGAIAVALKSGTVKLRGFARIHRRSDNPTPFWSLVALEALYVLILIGVAGYILQWAFQ